jgi:hypothetical protein
MVHVNMEVSPCCDRLCVCSAPQALIGDKLYSAAETWELKDLVVSSSSKDSGKHLTSTATVTLYDASAREEKMEAAIGIGPVDATFKAILKLIDRPIQLTNYVVTKIEGGSGPDNPGNDALASVVTHIKTARGSTASTEVSLRLDAAGHRKASSIHPQGPFFRCNA